MGFGWPGKMNKPFNPDFAIKTNSLNVAPMYLVKTPQIIQNLLPHYTWKIDTDEKVLHLTFDDGPIPEVTPWVLEQLARYDASATFFCVGENIKRNPSLLQEIIDAGHAVGNHTYNHLNAWKTENRPYFLNVMRCAHLVHSRLFRPPYGKLLPRQAGFLKRHYRIIMWDVLSGDFDPLITEEQCLQNVLKNAGKGSIVVFHDSRKAWENLKFTLPRVLEHFASKGYSFRNLDEALQSVEPLELN